MTVPEEQSGKKEHERHEEDVVEADEYCGWVPIPRVDDGKGHPPARPREKGRGVRRGVGMVSKRAVMRDHQGNDEAAKVADGVVVLRDRRGVHSDRGFCCGRHSTSPSGEARVSAHAWLRFHVAARSGA